MTKPPSDDRKSCGKAVSDDFGTRAASQYLQLRMGYAASERLPSSALFQGNRAYGCGTAIFLGSDMHFESEDFAAVNCERLLEAGEGTSVELRQTVHIAPVGPEGEADDGEEAFKGPERPS